MKKVNQVLFVILSLLIGGSAIVSCKKAGEGAFAAERMFRPGRISVATEPTKATLSWDPSLFTTSSNIKYTVELAKDSSFSTIVLTKVVDSAKLVLTDSDIQPRVNYVARVKANANNNIAESKWELSPKFSITGEQIFLALQASDVIDNAVSLKWNVTPGVTKITITPQSGTAVDYPISAAEASSGQKIISGLTANTNYSAEIFDATRSRGFLTFKTKIALSGNLIDLRSITGRPSVLTDTLPLIPDASTVILRRGETYTVSATFNLTKAVKIISGSDLTNPNMAIIDMPSNFNVVAGSNIGFVDFESVWLRGTDYASKYVFNISQACTIGRISFENCRASYYRGVCRLQTAVINMTDFKVNNCIMDSISNYGIINVDNVNCKVDNISLKNSTFYKVEKVVTSKQNSNSVVIDLCTFNEAPFGNSTSSFIVEYNTLNVSGGIQISNSIFGKGKPNSGNILVRDVRAGSGTTITSTNNYITTDHTVTANPLTPVTTYNGLSTTLWVSPLTGDFHFADQSFVGKNSAGDPRWK